MEMLGSISAQVGGAFMKGYDFNLLFKIDNQPLNIFIYLRFYVAFNTVQVISQRVVERAEETSTVCQGSVL